MVDCDICKNRESGGCLRCEHSDDLQDNYDPISKKEIAERECNKYVSKVISVNFSQEFYDVFASAKEFAGDGEYSVLQTGDDCVRACNMYTMVELKCNVPDLLRQKKIVRLYHFSDFSEMTADICTRDDLIWDRNSMKVEPLLTPQKEYPASMIAVSRLTSEGKKCVSLVFPSNTVYLNDDYYDRAKILGEDVSIGYNGFDDTYSVFRPTPVVFTSKKGRYVVCSMRVLTYYAPCEKCDDEHAQMRGDLCLSRLRHMNTDGFMTTSLLGDENCVPCPGYRPKEDATK
jgi:hypothetical protein